MKAVRIITILFLVIAFSITSVLGSVTAAAVPAPTKVESQNIRWKGKSVRIALSNSLTRFSSNIKTDSDVVGAVRRSVQAWMNAADIDVQLEFSDRQSVSPNGLTGDGVSLITIAQTPENVLFFAKDHDSASAKTRIFFNRKDEITEADIVLNPFQQFSTDGTFGTFDLESTITHEVGHLLGLRHLEVLGATMAASFAPNGTMGVVDLGPRTLAESDVTAIRELYGSRSAEEVCCAVISGKLGTSSGRVGRGIEVWAEETASGRVVAQAETGPDGGFQIGGLSGGNYSVYWRTKVVASGSMGEVGNVSIESGEKTVLNGKIALRPSEVSMKYLGRNGELADHGITLSAGGSSVITLGGKNLNDPSLKISFSSPFIKVSPVSVTAQEFGEGITSISFVITVDPDIAPGDYSVFVNGKGGPISCLIGAINVE